MLKPLCGESPDIIKELLVDSPLPSFAAKQIADWIYKKRISSFNEMNNISKKNKAWLNDHFTTGLTPPIKEQISIDGTKKYLFNTVNGPIESAYIPDGERATLCVSTQVGCKMGCTFCATGAMGFKGNLSAAEIINQLFSLPEYDTITNIVFMGMGEPLDNCDATIKAVQTLTAPWGGGMGTRRITVSTVGIIPGILRYAAETNSHLAVSLHNPFPEERIKIVPVESKYPIREVIKTLQSLNFKKERRITIEYTLIAGENDSERHIKELLRLLSSLRVRINLIPLNATGDGIYTATNRDAAVIFQNRLKAKGLTVTLRKSKGTDIQAACGLLATNSDTTNSES